MKKYKQGNASIEYSESIDKFFLGFLQKVIPNAERIMDEVLTQIQKEAIEDWPKRQPMLRKDKDGKVVFYRETSLESYSKFQRGIRISAKGEVEVYLRNNAPYSWAIKFGIDSKNKDGKEIIQTQCKIDAKELMIKPLKKYSKRVIKALSDDLIKKV